MSCEMTSGSRPTTVPYFWHRQEQTAVWRMPPVTHPAWVRSREGLFFHVQSGHVLPSLSGMGKYWTYVPHYCNLELLMVVRSTSTIDSEEEVVRTCLGSGRVHNASRRGAGQCVKGATGVVRQGRICLSLPTGKGMGKGILQLGHLVENRHQLQEMCRPRHVNHKSCLLEVRLEQGLGILLLLKRHLRLTLKNWSRHFSSFRVS